MQRNRILTLVLLLAAAGAARAQATKRPEFNPRRLIGPLPPITSPAVRPAREAGEDLVHDGELVLGVVAGGEARAYPINMLSDPRREIINDTLGGRALAATW